MNWQFILKNMGRDIGIMLVLMTVLVSLARWIWFAWRRKKLDRTTDTGRYRLQALRTGLTWGIVSAVLLLA